jgi:hypothetical protein
MDTAMSRGTVRNEPAGATPPAAAQHDAGANGAKEAATVVVEEIFLEGDSMTMLRHEAGSTQAIDLLASADMADAAPPAPKRP